MDYPETRYLPAFMAVCAEGGFHRAGEKLNLSQPAVSYQIRMLEQVLKVPLFERTPRGVVLTEAGEMLRDYCSRSLSDLSALRAQLQSGEMRARGTLKIASVSGFGRYVLFPLLAAEFADVRVELRYPTQDDVIRFVAAGICDLGVIYESKTSSLFDCSPLTSEELVLIGQKGSQRTIGGLEQVSRLPSSPTTRANTSSAAGCAPASANRRPSAASRISRSSRK